MKLSAKKNILLIICFLCIVSICIALSTSYELSVTILQKVNPPEWIKKTVMYEIYPRSFYDSDGDSIGDIKGIHEQLPYLQELGIGTLWLTPIFSSPSVHGYDPNDYYTIQKEYGTKNDLIQLVNAAHARNIRIILDLVTSHVSNTHPFFIDAMGNTSSHYSDWFIWKNSAHTQYASFSDNPTMPRLNVYNDDVQQYLIAVAKYWVKTSHVDGFRCDFVLNPTTPHSFWKKLRKELKKENPSLVLIAEAWTNQANIEPFYKNEFDAVFNFPAYTDISGQPLPIGDHALLAGRTFDQYARTIESQKKIFASDAIRIFFLNNHDTSRIMNQVFHDMRRAKMAALLLLTSPDTPMLYYGEEIGLLGRQKLDNEILNSEPVRGFMKWDTETTTISESNIHISSVKEQKAHIDSLFSYYKTLIHIRNSEATLQFGTFLRITTNQDPFVFAFARKLSNSMYISLFNTQDDPKSITLDLNHLMIPTLNFKLTNVLSQATFACKRSTCTIEMPPVTGELWKVEYILNH